MKKFLAELKGEHAAIERMLERVRDSEIPTLEAHRILVAAKESIISHLKKEDEGLYPVLQKAALNNPALRTTIDFYAKEMEEITGSVERFYEKYSSPEAELNIEFARDFGKFFALISRRCRSEEKTLYKEFEKLIR